MNDIKIISIRRDKKIKEMVLEKSTRKLVYEGRGYWEKETNLKSKESRDELKERRKVLMRYVIFILSYAF